MNEKKLQLVTLEQAKRLKELGFNWECDKIYAGKEPAVRAGGEYFPLERDVDTYANWNDPGYDWNDGVEKEWFSAPSVALALKWIEVEKEIINETFTRIKNFRLEYCWRFRVNYKETIGKKSFYTRKAAESALLSEILTDLEKEKEK